MLSAAAFASEVEQSGPNGVTVKIRATEHSKERAVERGIDIDFIKNLKEVSITRESFIAAYKEDKKEGREGTLIVKTILDELDGQEVIVGVVGIEEVRGDLVGNIVTVYKLDKGQALLDTWKSARWKEKVL